MKLNEDQIHLLIGLFNFLFSEDIPAVKPVQDGLPKDTLEELWQLRTDLYDSLTFTQSP